jgi:hypothetical protein
MSLLNATLCEKPKSTLESLNIIHGMRTIVLNDYESVLNTLEKV